ncbi:aromatase/cyclase [Streptomyces antimicrobicus]|uniref:Aromatase/cyclase n=1 Tax=Streptomyces antimicrobicus TaxID=2883108 RepID=A0ABS8B8U1_9ACTN|nr:aromatase/cyclase [Streptomyces antimicrobicus]MCB5181022.1 aromatase/cyclase [Streptomyces antimicrobicus]
MPTEQVHRTSHQVEADAPADTVYALLADAERWPLLFPPTVHVRRLDPPATGGTGAPGTGAPGSRPGTAAERLQIWATANGTLKHWTSRRDLDPVARRIGFRQEVPAPPLSAMGGTWTVDPLGPGRCRVTLLHDFRVAGDRAEDVAWVLRATDTNSRAELARLARLAERPRRLEGLLFSFADRLRIEEPAPAVLDRLDHGALWPAPVPATAASGAAAGTPEPPAAAVVRLPQEARVVFKTPGPVAPLAVHTGSWTVTAEGPGAATVTVRQRVVLRTEADRPRVRQDVREELGRAARTALARLRDAHALILCSGLRESAGFATGERL